MSSLRHLKKNASSDGNNQPKFRVAVLGESGVGKTAFIVRFVTNKFIGEYDRDLEIVYQYSYPISEKDLVFFEVSDAPRQQKEKPEILKEKIKWADAFILLYSVSDRVSYTEIARLKFLISHQLSGGSSKMNQRGPPIAIVGNKKDLEVERMVETKEAKSFADSLNCLFCEISVRESVEEVSDVFTSLYKSYKITKKIDFFRAKSTSYLDMTIRQNYQAKKKQRSFKHINKIPRMQGSPETGRAAFRMRHRLQTDSENSDTGDERPLATKCNESAKAQSVFKTQSFVDRDVKRDSTSCFSSSDDSSCAEESSRDVTLNEEYIRKIAEEFQRKTLLLALD